MRIWDIIVLSGQALKAHLLRTSLTVLGVIIGVTSVIAIVSIVEGMNAKVAELLNAMGPSVFMVEKIGIVTSEEEYFKMRKRKDLSIRDYRAIEQTCETCDKVAASVYTRRTLKFRNEKLNNVTVMGSSANIIQINDLEIDDGRFFSTFEDDHSKEVVVVGPTVVEELYGEQNPIGRELKIGGYDYRILGITKERGAILGNDLDRYVIIPLNSLRKHFGANRTLSISVRAKSPETLQITMDEVRMLLRARRNVSYDEEDDFSITTSDAYMELYKQVTSAVRVTAIAIPAIALVVAGIVVMNIMMVSVTERTREIGIRKSLGARRKSILLQFVLEALLMSLGGGVVGIILGLISAKALADAGSLPFVISPIAVFSGIFVSTGIGVIFGMYPAIKGSKLDPVDAMRYE